jgi:hypothetical protein
MNVIGDVAIVVAVVALLIVPSVVCWLKGKKLWATLGFFTNWHWIPVIRLAKPDSWWARRFYDDEKMWRARARFSELPDDADAAPVEAVEEFSRDDIVYQDKVTRKAWEKAQKSRAREAARD